MMSAVLLVVFLGNPGKEYALTRHNYGWMVAQVLDGGTLAWQQKFKGEYALWEQSPRKIWFLKPQTFMNLSGESVKAFLNFYKLSVSDLLVLHDDIELPEGE